MATRLGEHHHHQFLAVDMSLNRNLARVFVLNNSPVECFTMFCSTPEHSNTGGSFRELSLERRQRVDGEAEYLKELGRPYFEVA